MAPHFKIMQHEQDERGFGVSLRKYDGRNDEPVGEMELISTRNAAEQAGYIARMRALTGFAVEASDDD